MKFNSPKQSSPSSSNDNTLWIVLGFILLVVIIMFIFWSTTDDFKSRFGNVFAKQPSLKDLEMTMFMKPTCPWCQKTLDMLKKEGVDNQIEIVDISTPEGLKYASMFGADKQPVPNFISKKLRKGTVGYRQSVKELIGAISSTPEPPSSNPPPMGGNGVDFIEKVRSLNIILFARDGCGYCSMAKEACNNSGIMDVIQVVDITTPEGSQLAGQVLPPGTNSVPAFISMATKKNVIGFSPEGSIENIIERLS